MIFRGKNQNILLFYMFVTIYQPYFINVVFRAFMVSLRIKVDFCVKNQIFY